MKILNKLIVILSMAILMISCGKRTITVTSPDGNTALTFLLSENGIAQYSLKYNNQSVIGNSRLGIDFKKIESLKSNFEIKKTTVKIINENWSRAWGETKNVKNNYKYLTVELHEKSKLERRLTLHFKVYNDGVGFRYEVPEQKNISQVIITDERSEFKLTGDHKSWWIPADWDSYEHLYSSTKVSKIDGEWYIKNPKLSRISIKDRYAVHTPVTMKTDEGIYISIHEANLTNYASMTLHVDRESLVMSSALVGNDSGDKVKTKTPFVTPWRTIQVASTAGKLIESNLIVNLNEPNKIEDTSWIKPMKYMGIWWEMHLGKASWDISSGKHGATTENAKYYIDFASKHNIKGLLIEGWNTGWEHWLSEDKDKAFDFVTPYSDFDIEEVVAYGKKHGVEIVGHHETSAAVATYEKHMDKAYAFYNKVGVKSIKTGYVGEIIPRGEYHHGQYMVNHYRRVTEKTAKAKIMIVGHEPIKATGIRRTYPNYMAREGVRGQEFNAWGDPGNTPEHTTILTFTRMLAGPIDFTPGIFNIKFDEYKKNNAVPTTLAKQLALYVVIYSPVQMAADLPEHYENQPAFKFIEDVAVNWDDSKVLNGEIGEYLTIARKEKNSSNWFLGSITNEKSRKLDIKLDFLDKNKKYKAIIYSDTKKSHWSKNPIAINIKEIKVNSDSTLSLDLAPGGGQAISFVCE